MTTDNRRQTTSELVQVEEICALTGSTPFSPATTAEDDEDLMKEVKMDVCEMHLL